MKAYPSLQTNRLTLNQPQIADIPVLIDLLGDPQIAATTASIPHPYYEKDAIHFLNRSYKSWEQGTAYIFAIRDQQQQYIGGIGLHLQKASEKAEIGYWIGVPYWNKGYATEATQAILKFGFEELKLNKIFASHMLDNPASGKVLIHNQMIQEAILKDEFKKNGVFKTLVQYRLTVAEYQALSMTS